eukprot:PITA_08779
MLKNEGMVDGLPALHNVKLECDGCALGKMHRDEFPVRVNRKQRDILELVHTDIYGPMQTRSLGGYSDSDWAGNLDDRRSITGYSDSDWAGNLDDRRSITGYAFSIGSGVISWCSKKQSTVALLSCEVEYQALCAATCEAIWLRRLLSDAGEGQKAATSIKTDNQSTIKLAYNPVFHKNTKHIDTQFHIVREKIQTKEICVDYCNTCDNLADIFTKPLGRIKFELLRGMLGVHNNPFFIKGGS